MVALTPIYPGQDPAGGVAGVSSFNGRSGSVLALAIDYANYYGAKINNIIIVNEEANFPTQDANTITLGSGAELGVAYVLGASIATAKNINIVGNCVIESFSVFAELSYTAAPAIGEFITFTDCFIEVNDITISSPGNVAFKGVSTAPGTIDHRVNFSNCFVNDCSELYLSDGAGIITNTLQVQNVTGHAVEFLAENVGICSLNQLGVFGLTAGNSLFKADPVGAIFTILEMTDVAGFGDAGAHFIDAGVNGANLAPGSVAVIAGSNAISFTTPLVGVTTEDFEFRANAGIPNSSICADAYLDTPTTVAVLAANTFYKVNQSNWSSNNACRLTVSTDGDFTNGTDQDMLIKLDGSITVEKDGGGSELITARMVIDDTPSDPQSIATSASTQSTNPTAIPMTGLFNLPPGSSVSIWVATSGTADILVDNANFSTLEPI